MSRRLTPGPKKRRCWWGKSEPSAGLVGTTIVAADGFTTSSDTGDNEGYAVSTNLWSSLTADPTPRNASCYGSLSSQLYVAEGLNVSAVFDHHERVLQRCLEEVDDSGSDADRGSLARVGG